MRAAGCVSFSCKPLQKPAVSDLFNQRHTPAWRLNSALRASNNAARARGNTLPADKVRNSTVFSQAGRGKDTASLSPFPTGRIQEPGAGENQEPGEPGGWAGIRRAGQERIGGSCLEKRVYMRRTVVV